MTCAEAVRAYLVTLSPVTALVAVTSITVNKYQQHPALPAVCLFQISDVQDPHLRGTSGLAKARIQIDVIASTMSQARAVDAAIQGTYTAGSATGLRGTTFSIGSPGLSILSAFPGGYREIYDAEELKQYRVSRDYIVSYSE